MHTAIGPFGRGPAVHTAIGPWRMRFSGAHSAQTLGDEVHSAIRSWQRGLARHLAKRPGEEEDWRGEGGGEGEAALIKSSNPHLADEEKTSGTRLPLRKTQITTTNDRMSTNAYDDSSYSIKSNSLHVDFI